MNINNFKFNELGKIEVLYFYLFVVINALPLILFSSFPSVDGPAHLYNSRLILDILGGHETILSDFFELNNQLNPNWTGHFLLVGLFTFLPALLAEKILLLIYIILFPICFRYFFLQLKLKEKYLLYFIFPFTYSFLLFYGFYNFHLGLVLFFLSLGCWIKYIRKGFNINRILILTFLSTAIYFSHLFVFCIYILILFIIFLKETYHGKKMHAFKLNSLVPYIVSISPGVILTLIYFLNNPINGGINVYLNFSDLIDMLVQIQPTKGIEYGKESNLAKGLFICFSIILLYSIIRKFILFKRPINSKSIQWGIVCITLLILLFISPDTMGGSVGFISSRLALFFFLFFVIFLATQKTHLWLKITMFLLINYLNVAFIVIYNNSVAKENQVISALQEVSEEIEPYSIVLPLTNGSFWLHEHYSNYIGIDKPMVILKNYEASLNYFPINWNYKDIPSVYPNKSNKVIGIPESSNSIKREIDYILFISETTNESFINGKSIEGKTIEDYELIYSGNNGMVQLFRKK